MSKLASIYLRKGKFFVSASHKTDAGFWVSDEENSVIESNDESTLQGAIVAALQRSQNGFPTPPREADLVGSLLSAANVSSWSTFSKLAKCVDVYLEKGKLVITPYKNIGGSDGFEPMTKNAVVLPEGSTALGSAVIAAFAMAE